MNQHVQSQSRKVRVISKRKLDNNVGNYKFTEVRLKFLTTQILCIYSHRTSDYFQNFKCLKLILTSKYLGSVNWVDEVELDYLNQPMLCCINLRDQTNFFDYINYSNFEYGLDFLFNHIKFIRREIFVLSLTFICINLK